MTASSTTVGEGHPRVTQDTTSTESKNQTKAKQTTTTKRRTISKRWTILLKLKLSYFFSVRGFGIHELGL